MNKKIKKNWEFDVLGIDNYKRDGKLLFYYNFIKENINKIQGDLLEVGVFRGKTIISTALLLKELGTNKKVYGFDSFEGFPIEKNSFDDFSQFSTLYKENKISREHYEDHQKLISIKTDLEKISPNFSNISSSGLFDNTSYDYVKNKIDYFSLDNIELVKGDFKKTMQQEKKYKFMSVFLDCDLYDSYVYSLNFSWKHMISGAFMYLDEYYSLKFPGARIACDDFFENKKDKPFLISNYENDFERWGVFKS